MPTATEQPGRVARGRRHWLVGGALAVAGLGAAGRLAASSTSSTSSVRLAATWEDRHAGPGRFAAGLLQADASGALVVRGALAVPGRAHGVWVEADGRLLVVARRPGDWLARLDPAGRRTPVWQWSDGETVFNGHVLTARDGRTLYTTETDRQTGQGLIGVRDPASLALVEHWPVGGLDPHELCEGPDGSLWVAVGGIELRPETGRARHRLDAMASSLARIDTATGQVTGRWTLPDSRLSLRHLAITPRGRIGIAMQAEHDDPAQRAKAPVLAVWDPDRGLQAVPLPDAGPRAAIDGEGGLIDGYGGSIAAVGEGFVVSCPRAGLALHWRLNDNAHEVAQDVVHGSAPEGASARAVTGSWLPPLALDQVCPLAVSGPPAHPVLWAGGIGEACRVRADARVLRLSVVDGMRLDNHWAIHGVTGSH